MTKTRENIRLGLWVTPILKEKLSFQAQEKHITVSEYSRRLLIKGTDIAGYQKDTDMLTEIIDGSIRSVTDEFLRQLNIYVDRRMIPMMFKIGKMSGANICLQSALLAEENGLLRDAIIQEALTSGVRLMQFKSEDMNHVLSDASYFNNEGQKLQKRAEHLKNDF
ncbi:MAG: hypothetical protein RR233_09240 [Clostridiales bacterium]